ncbi:MAG TPA: PAS domain-containing protein, partial [Spirochaetia bacterium]|nr:PAS domain-containing protein [Spirochaetia bacterium]
MSIPAEGAGENRYRAIFEHAAVSLWEEDISRLRARLRQVRQEGASLRAYLEEHPEFVQEAVGLIDVIDVNEATLRLLEVPRKEMLQGLSRAELTDVSKAAMRETILAIDEGRTEVETESTVITASGRTLHLIARTYVPPAGAAYDRMLISFLDVTARREAEERERRSDLMLRSIVDSVPDAVFFKDCELKMVACNAVHSRSVGKEPEETYGKTDVENGWEEELVKGNPAKGIPGWERDDRAALAGNTVQVAGVPSNVQGEIRYFDAVKFPLRDASGQIIGIAGIGRDVTEQKRLAEELAEERRLFGLLMDHLPSQIYFKDREGRYLRNSRSHAVALGVNDPLALRGTSDFDYYSRESAEEFRRDELRVMHTGVPLVDVEERQGFADGREAWALTTKMPFHDPRGKVAGTFGMSRDITQRRRLELRNQQLATLVDSSDDAIVGIGMDRLITVWNRGAERIYGFTAEEMIGTSTRILIPDEREEEARVMRERLARGENIEHFETVRCRKDGTRIVVSLTLSAIRDAAGKVVGMASVARDVTVQKALQERLARMQRLESVATLAGGVAHRFNNINTVVKGYLGMLKSEPQITERLRKFISAADDAVNRAVDITDRLLMMTEPVGTESMVRLDLLAQSVVTGFGKLLDAEGARLELGLEEVPLCAGDETRLRFVLSSLLSNALDAVLDR